MPRKRGRPPGGENLKNPVAAIARGIRRRDAEGHAGMEDFVREAAHVIRVEVEEDRIEEIANALFEDCGQQYATDEQMAAFMYAELTRSHFCLQGNLTEEELGQLANEIAKQLGAASVIATTDDLAIRVRIKDNGQRVIIDSKDKLTWGCSQLYLRNQLRVVLERREP